MDTFLLFGLVGFSLAIIGVFGYTAYTNKIIREQEKEIARLTTDNMRLAAALRGGKYIKRITVYDRPINNPKAAVIPDYKEW